MSNHSERQGSRERQVDEEMAKADRANGERPVQDEDGSAQRPDGSDPEAPGAYVDDEHASRVAEPNEPA